MDTHDRDWYIDSVKETYEPRIIRFLNDAAATLVESGQWHKDGDVFDMHDANYRWSVVLVPEEPALRDDRSSHAIDLSLEIDEATQFGDDPDTGIAFYFSMVETGGRILGTMAPYNHSGQCWVDAKDSKAVAKRWGYFEDASVDELPDLAESSLRRWVKEAWA
jgi:hypothetical protein